MELLETIREKAKTEKPLVILDKIVRQSNLEDYKLSSVIAK